MTNPDQPHGSRQSADPSAPIVSILIVSFNTRDMTLECLRSVARETSVPHEVILVDNASRDGSAEAVAAAFPDVRLMAEADNHGFAKGNNIAAGVARGDYILLLNPDTVVLDGAIDALVAFARREPDAMIWGGRTLYGDRRLNPTSCWARMTLWSVFCTTTGLSSIFAKSRTFNPEAYGDWQRDTDRAVDIVTGAFFLTRRETWNRLGGFDLRYVMYGEEADLCLRARALGASPMITPDATIIHYVGASEQLRGSKMVMLLKAKILLIRDHFPDGQKALATWMFRLWPLLRLFKANVRARLSRGAGRSDMLLTLREVWAKRADWWGGWA